MMIAVLQYYNSVSHGGECVMDCWSLSLESAKGDSWQMTGFWKIKCKEDRCTILPCATLADS